MAARILVVDDEIEIRDVLSQFLGKLGYEVETAPDGTSALEKFRSYSPHFIFLDLMMPDISGIEVLKMIREIDKQARVIMISGMHDLGMAKEAMLLGALDYITKPIEFKFLQKFIERETKLMFGSQRSEMNK